MHPELRYRRATGEDVTLLAAMNRRLIQDEGHRNPMTPAQLAERMRGWLAENYKAYLVSPVGGHAAVGYCLFRVEPEHVYIRQLYVEREWRRAGIARRLIEFLKRRTWKDVPRLRVETLVGNSVGLAFWRGIGFADYCLTLECDLGHGSG